jgi:hypothetical protein
VVAFGVPMNPHERATRVWYRIAGLLGRKELAPSTSSRGISAAQQEAFLEAAKLVLTGDPIEIARQLHERAERTVRRSKSVQRKSSFAAEDRSSVPTSVVLGRGLLRPRRINDLQSCPLEIVRGTGGHAQSQVI